MPLSLADGLTEKDRPQVVDSQSNGPGHGPSKVSSLRTSKPILSRLKVKLTSMSRVTIAELCTFATGPPEWG